MISILGIFGCKSHIPLQTVDKIDLQKYTGKWYEIAAFPQRFEKGCNCTTAEYELSSKGFIKVINSCRKNSTDGLLTRIEGKAFIDKNNNAKLKVQFFWPFKGKYWIIDLADDYSYAVVGHPNRKYLWILCRNPFIEKSIYDGIIKRIKEKGFDVSKLVTTNQGCK
ncbi:MAG: lipocalin family protein [Bacteroidales bacterium]